MGSLTSWARGYSTSPAGTGSHQGSRRNSRRNSSGVPGGRSQDELGRSRCPARCQRKSPERRTEAPVGQRCVRGQAVEDDHVAGLVGGGCPAGFGHAGAGADALAGRGGRRAAPPGRRSAPGCPSAGSSWSACPGHRIRRSRSGCTGRVGSAAASFGVDGAQHLWPGRRRPAGRGPPDSPRAAAAGRRAAG